MKLRGRAGMLAAATDEKLTVVIVRDVDRLSLFPAAARRGDGRSWRHVHKIVERLKRRLGIRPAPERLVGRSHHHRYHITRPLPRSRGDAYWLPELRDSASNLRGYLRHAAPPRDGGQHPSVRGGALSRRHALFCRWLHGHWRCGGGSTTIAGVKYGSPAPLKLDARGRRLRAVLAAVLVRDNAPELRLVREWLDLC
jgi:hypothetical protein